LRIEHLGHLYRFRTGVGEADCEIDRLPQGHIGLLCFKREFEGGVNSPFLGEYVTGDQKHSEETDDAPHDPVQVSLILCGVDIHAMASTLTHNL
jgi:hypothetical protein